MELIWVYDGETAYWAERMSSIIKSTSPQKQYSGNNLWENTWNKYIIRPNFPDFCRAPSQQGYILCSPNNIVRCYQEGLILEALALTVGWGNMARTQGKIYTRSKAEIQKTLLDCVERIRSERSVKSAWNSLVLDLGWSAVMSSKCLHFLSRSQEGWTSRDWLRHRLRFGEKSVISQMTGYA